ncbi:MAG: hypothetical protein R2701_12210 [Acidimicrobiales bacterium]
MAAPSPGSSSRSQLAGPVLLVLGSMTSLQFGAAIASHLFDDVGAAGASALRLGLAAVILLGWARPAVRSWSSERVLGSVALGVSMACMNAAFYEAVARLLLGAAITIEFLGPLGLAVVLTRRWRELLWVVLAVGGVVILGLGQHGGAGESLGSARRGGCLGGGRALGGVHRHRVAVGHERVGRGRPGGRERRRRGARRPVRGGLRGSSLLDARVLALGAAMAVLASVVPYSFEIRALARMAKRTFSILVSLEPAIRRSWGSSCSVSASSRPRSWASRSSWRRGSARPPPRRSRATLRPAARVRWNATDLRSSSEVQACR